MKTYLRYPMILTDSTATKSKVPNEAKEELEILFNKCEAYCINSTLRIILLPIDSNLYGEVMSFINRYKEWANKLVTYEHKFTKTEIQRSEYFLVASKSLVCIKGSIGECFESCCSNGSLLGNQKDYFKVNRVDIKNKLFTATNTCRYFITQLLKDSLTQQSFTNIQFLPVYDDKTDDVVAYQVEVNEVMPSLSELNGWITYKECSQCGKKIYDVIQNYPHPFYLPANIKTSLKDFNATLETFSEADAKYYIISRRFLEALESMGVKGLICQPIVFK